MNERAYDARVGRREDLRAIDGAVATVARVANSHRARRRIEDRAGVPLGPTGVSALAAVHAMGPVRHGAVARRMGIQPSRVTKEVRVLVEAGLVAEWADPNDRRAVLLEVTPAGADAYRRYRRAAESALAEVLDGWSDRDVGQLATLLTRLATAFATTRDE